MPQHKPATFGELKQHVDHLPDVRTEMRLNLIEKLKSNEPIFSGVIGYEETVLPALVNAILCGHNMILLGERGQGKSRIIRGMIDFLDEEMPAVAGCPIHDSPFNPICYEVVDDSQADIIANLAKQAVKVVFDTHFKLEELSSITDAFENGVSAEVSQDQPSLDYLAAFNIIPGIEEAAATLVDPANPAEASAAIEFILEGRHLSHKLNREVIQNRLVYK
jgi:hypothetical protein